MTAINFLKRINAASEGKVYSFGETKQIPFWGTGYETMLLQSHYHGFIMIELRVDENREYMIEANPRFWGPSQLFVDAGYNSFEIFLKEYGFLNKQIVLNHINEDVFYYWNGGVVQQEYINQVPVFLSNGKKIFDCGECMKHDIYYRKDTMQLFEDCC